MLLGVIADDFTGAGDIANTLAAGHAGMPGLVTSQYMGVPATAAGADIEAGVVSLKTRSVAPAEAVAQSLAALQWLRAQGCRQIVFKYCSTFDSTPQGNIGPVAVALADALGAGRVVVCPAFPRTGRTVYQGHLFVQDRLLNESGMQDHPLTPMTDADLRRWLARQVSEEIGHLPHAVVARGEAAVAAALSDAGERLVVVDAVSDGDLVAIGRACAGAALLTGGSGIALGLPGNFIAAGLAKGNRTQGFRGIDGPEAIMAGSCSGATRGQVDRHARDHPTRPVSVERVMSGEQSVSELVGFMLEHRGRAPLIYSSGTPEDVRAAQDRYGRAELSERLETLFAAVAREFLDKGGRRLVVAGGETSGAVASALELGEVIIGPEIAPGVPVLVSNRRNAALALKSGNFGQPDFFLRATRMLAGDAA